MNEAKGFVPGYPQSMLDILGKCNIVAAHGSTHKYTRGTLLSIISSTLIRNQLLPKIDRFMRTHLSHWENKVINIQDKIKQMAFLSSLKQIAGMETSSISQPFMTEFFKRVLGTLSLPLNLPSTNYRCGLQARKSIISILSRLLKERRESKENYEDMLSCLMRGNNDYRCKLNDEELIDLIITIMYSGYETISTNSMMAVKYLHDHPKVLEEMRKQHFSTRERKNPKDPIDCNDLKSMRFTRTVLVRNIPPDPDESVSELVVYFFLVNHPNNYLTHQRFLPSEFGHDVDRADPVEPGLVMYKQKRLVRRVIEESGVPYAYICCNSIASWPYYNNCHPSSLPPPLDQLHVYGNGNTKAYFVDGFDIGKFTMKIVDDDRTINKNIHFRLYCDTCVGCL